MPTEAAVTFAARMRCFTEDGPADRRSDDCHEEGCQACLEAEIDELLCTHLDAAAEVERLRCEAHEVRCELSEVFGPVDWPLLDLASVLRRRYQEEEQEAAALRAQRDALADVLICVLAIAGARGLTPDDVIAEAERKVASLSTTPQEKAPHTCSNTRCQSWDCAHPLHGTPAPVTLKVAHFDPALGKALDAVMQAPTREDLESTLRASVAGAQAFDQQIAPVFRDVPDVRLDCVTCPDDSCRGAPEPCVQAPVEVGEGWTTCQRAIYPCDSCPDHPTCRVHAVFGGSKQ